MKYLILLFLILTVNILSSNEDPIYYPVETKANNLDNIEGIYTHRPKSHLIQNSAIINRNYDVLKYDLYFDLTNFLNSTIEDSEEKKFYTGTSKIKFILNEQPKRIEIDAVDFIIDSIVNENLSLDFIYNDKIIEIHLNESVEIGDTISLSIHFSKINKDNLGILFYNKGASVNEINPKTGEIVKAESNIVYTQSEPDLTRYWVPCFDSPHDKALVSISAKVPDGYTLASNGLLDSLIETQSGNIYYWNSKYVMSTYLMVLHASEYVVFYDEYIREKDGEKIPFEYYVWESDRGGNNEDVYFDAELSFRNHVPMMEYFESIFSDYPFEKYGIASVYPYMYGGMEHQTMTTVNRMWLRNGGDDGFAHELAHHWIGDYVTCATWADLWFNEGGATWSEALWAVAKKGEGEYNKYIRRNLSFYMVHHNAKGPRALYGKPVSTLFSSNAFITYSKAALIFHMMSEIVGREKFLEALKDIFEKYKYSVIETKDFESELYKKFYKLRPVVGSENKLFFDQWVYKEGHPYFDIDLTLLNVLPDGTYDIRIRYNQIQASLYPENDVPECFEGWPLSIEIFKGNQIVNTIDTTLFCQGIFRVNTDVLPDSIDINGIKLLRTIAVRNINNIENAKELDGIIKVFPNIINDNNSAELRISLDGSYEKVTIELYDLAGNLIESIYNGHLNNKAHSFFIKSEYLQSGMYFLKTQIGLKSYVEKIIINK